MAERLDSRSAVSAFMTLALGALSRFFTDGPYFKIVILPPVGKIRRSDVENLEITHLKKIPELIQGDLVPMAFVRLLRVGGRG